LSTISVRHDTPLSRDTRYTSIWNALPQESTDASVASNACRSAPATLFTNACGCVRSG
jgi:hypothetical protein